MPVNRTRTPRTREAPPAHLDMAAFALLPREFIERHRIVPLSYDSSSNTLAVGVPQGTTILLLDNIRAIAQAEIQPRTLDDAQLAQHLTAITSITGDLDTITGDNAEDTSTSGERTDDDAGIDDSTIVRIVNLIISDAADRDASDIHIQPSADRVLIRFREDGVLHNYQELAKSVHAALVARVKVLANLDIANTRKPQDGRMKRTINKQVLDLRVSTLPTVEGEKVVMRLLKDEAALLKINQLGFQPHVERRFVTTIERPYGLILVTGPTGSGKSYTLFSALDRLNTPDVNISTVEDPVEYRLPGIAQVQVNPKAGVTFASTLRSFLRQDPDIIMIGEIRDRETAAIGIEAALTGHLVLATLHTNDAVGAIRRLTEMGVEPFNITASLLGVLAQRLVRRVCPTCAQPTDPPAELLDALGIQAPDHHNYRTGHGCPNCDNIGYRGRIAIQEFLVHAPWLEEAIATRATAETMTKSAIEYGMTTLREDAIHKAFAGITTLDEVLRVTDA